MKREKDFRCWVLDVFLWENHSAGLAGLSCVPWAYRNVREPKMILRRSVRKANEAKSVVAQLFSHSTGASVVIRAEEE